MRGVILAGGLGTRMGLISKAVNKHCNLVYRLPMILYPLLTLRESGIDEILVVTSEGSAGQLINLLGNGEDYGVEISYVFQTSPMGIADALSGAEKFSQGEHIAVVLGDNFYHPTPTSIVEGYHGGARIILTTTDSPSNFGIVTMEEAYYIGELGDSYYNVSILENGNMDLGTSTAYLTLDDFITAHSITGIVEKPQDYVGNLMVTGLYMYDYQVWDIIRGLVPSARGEYEITAVNNAYLEMGELDYQVYTGTWLDCGNPDALLDVANYVRSNADDFRI